MLITYKYIPTYSIYIYLTNALCTIIFNLNFIRFLKVTGTLNSSFDNSRPAKFQELINNM